MQNVTNVMYNTNISNYVLLMVLKDLNEWRDGLYSVWKFSTVKVSTFLKLIHISNTTPVDTEALCYWSLGVGQRSWAWSRLENGSMVVFPGTIPPQASKAHYCVHCWNLSAQTRDGVSTRQPTSQALLSVQLLLFDIKFKMKWESPCCKPLIRTTSAFDRSPTWDNWSWSVNN